MAYPSWLRSCYLLATITIHPPPLSHCDIRNWFSLLAPQSPILPTHQKNAPTGFNIDCTKKQEPFGSEVRWIVKCVGDVLFDYESPMPKKKIMNDLVHQAFGGGYHDDFWGLFTMVTPTSNKYLNLRSKQPSSLAPNLIRPMHKGSSSKKRSPSQII